MQTNHTKIVATIGPASNSRPILKKMVKAGMSVARLNFSHGSYAEHTNIIALLRSVAEELDTPITLVQDLQGPKIRIGTLPDGEIELNAGDNLIIVPLDQYDRQPQTVAIDYPYLATEAKPGMQILIDDGTIELKVTEVERAEVRCQVIEGGILKSRKGVNLPNLELSLPALTDKDRRDLEFGLQQGLDWVCLSFVRSGEDLRVLKSLLAEKGRPNMPVIAKIEKPQAIANLDSILKESDAIMVARGDLGVEMSPEKVPMLQKQIISKCNRLCIPVITATQMLDSMIRHPRPTRAEASDVANAIIDGTDAVMLSGESAVGKYPVRAVKMLAKIAADVEPELHFENNPPAYNDETHALSEALNCIDKILPLSCIVTFTSSGYTSLIAAGERPQAPIVSFTPDRQVYHRLNLIWGVKPILIDYQVETFEDLIVQAETYLRQRQLVEVGDRVLIMAGIPTQKARGTNFLKIHTIN